MRTYDWAEIGDVPVLPGVYAWYYRPEITRFDLDTAVRDIVKKKESGDDCGAQQAISDFLEKVIFRYFIEDPYEAELKGPLKPYYKGIMHHAPSLSPSLVKRIFKEPKRLITIKNVIESSAPEFASPLYIGMSENLRIRLMRHKSLVECYRDQQKGTNFMSANESRAYDSDSNFAHQVARRQMMPTRLFVVVREMECDRSQYIDIENILNRIHYPLLGRN